MQPSLSFLANLLTWDYANIYEYFLACKDVNFWTFAIDFS